MNSAKLNEKGFTLVELIIVVVITGILAAVAYPTYTRFLTDSRAKEAEAVIGAMAAAIKSARQQENTYADVTLDPPAGNWIDISTANAPYGDGIYLIGTVQIDTGEGVSFEYMIDNINTNTFRITARGIANQLGSADTLTLSYNGTSNPRATWSATGVISAP